MKKKWFIIGLLNLIFIFNLEIIDINNVGQLSFHKLEALSHCESPIEYYNGKSTTLTCYNPDGSYYLIKCCDFDSGYDSFCQGRSCGKR